MCTTLQCKANSNRSVASLTLWHYVLEWKRNDLIFRRQVQVLSFADDFIVITTTDAAFAGAFHNQQISVVWR